METRAKLKTDLYVVKLIMQKVTYIPLENILVDDPLPRMSKKSWIFDRRGGCQFTDFNQFILVSTAHEWIILVTLGTLKTRKKSWFFGSIAILLIHREFSRFCQKTLFFNVTSLTNALLYKSRRKNHLPSLQSCKIKSECVYKFLE